MSTKDFVIIAEFEVHEGKREEFLKFAKTDAEGSVNNEPGCQQFDALIDDDFPNLVVLHEVYDDEAAFEYHNKQPHFLEFDAGVQPLTVSKTVRIFSHHV